MESKRIDVDTFDVDGKPLSLVVVRPGNRVCQEANMAYNLQMANLIRQGSQNSGNRLLLRDELEEYLQKTGVWTLKDAFYVEKLAIEIRAYELILKKGGMTDLEGRKVALQMAEKRQLIMEKHAKRQQFDSATVESQAENYRFEFLLVQCLVVKETSAKFLKNHSDYVDRQDEIAVVDGAKVLANMVYGLETNMHKSMFELRWLKEANMINDDGQFINRAGKLTDREGLLVNQDGRYINDAGVMVDTFGQEVDEVGNLLVDSSLPFTNSETGEDMVICGIGEKPQTEKKKAKPKPKIKRKKKKTAKKVD